MFSARPAQFDWALYERVTRSLAHSVGNTINVVWGRLSLVELDPGLQPTSLASIERARARLKTLQEELKSALGLPPPDEFPPESVRDILRRLAPELGVELGNAELLTREELGQETSSELGMRCVANACAILDGDAQLAWQLGLRTHQKAEGLTLTFTLDAKRAPPHRKALLEPWFSEEAHALEGRTRHGRLLLAQALGLLEEAGATLDVHQVDEALTGVTLSWHHARV